MKSLRIAGLATLLLAGIVHAQLSFVTNSGAITITGYNTAAGLNVVIPASTNGLPVVSIGQSAFFNSSIANVTIPNSVTNLDIGAFESCTSLTSVTIPNSVNTINFGAFYYCTSLTNVTMSVGIVTIGSEAFEQCFSLNRVVIPNSVTNIGSSAFQSCINLTNVTIGSGVISIPAFAFYGCALTGVTIPDNVIMLGASSFASCHSLTSAAIGSGVNSIGGPVFGLCSSLTNIAVSSSNPAYSSLNGALFDKAQATLIEYAIGLTNNTFIVPNSVTNIGIGAFAACPALSNVTISSNVTSIGSQAFWECTSLTNVTFLGNAPAPNNDATVFSGDTHAIAYYLSGTSGWGSTFDGIATALEVVTPTILNTIYAFSFGPSYYPQAGLALGTDGNLYGTTFYGDNNYGKVFMATKSGIVTNFAMFNYVTGHPSPGTLVQGNDGAFYGTTYGNIASYAGVTNYGTFYRVRTNGTITVLAQFYGTNGASPNGLVLANDGSFYGTTSSGGLTNNTYPSGMGTIFRVTTNGVITSLYNFSAITNGATPYGILAIGPDGSLYGTTSQGGYTNVSAQQGFGTAFKLTTNGTFTSYALTNSNGIFSPQAGLTMGSDGSLYGVGAYAVFKLTTNGAISTVASFLPGAVPTGNLLQGPDGNLYGTTTQGGAFGDGTLFNVTPNGTNNILVNFDGITNGSMPESSLTLGDDGYLYGTTAGNGGTIFRLGLPPGISIQPTNQTVLTGSNGVFLVTAYGSQPLSYQWFFNGIQIAGATNGSLVVSNVQNANVGNYQVAIANTYGSVTSSIAPLSSITQVTSIDWFKVAGGGGTSTGGVFTVSGTFGQADAAGPLNGGGFSLEGGFWSPYALQTASASGTAPIITGYPSNQIIPNGLPLALTISVFGTAPLFYQWQRNGVNLTEGGDFTGSTSNSLSINVSTNDGGNYTCIAENAYGAATSTAAKVTVVLLTLSTNMNLITFDDITDYNSPTNGYHGLNWRGFNALNAVTYFLNPSGYQAGMVSASNVAYVTTGSIWTSQPFNLVSAYVTSAWNDNEQLIAQGYGATTYSNSFALSATSPTLIRFNYLGVTNVSLSAVGGTPHAGYSGSGSFLAVDNMTISTNQQDVFPPKLQNASLSGGNYKFSWKGVVSFPPMSGYQVQYTTNLLSTWTDLGGPVTGTNFSITLSSDKQGFYRVLLMQ